MYSFEKTRKLVERMQAQDCGMNCCTIWFQSDPFQRVFLSMKS